jgi:energy-coupling factor transporter transmembrane protein EcfT
VNWEERDPRAKALLVLAPALAVLVAPPERALITALAAFLLLALSAPHRLGGALRTALFLWILTVAANGFFTPGDRIGPDALGGFRPTREGLAAGWGQGGRLAALAALGAWAAAKTRAFDLVASLEWSVRGWPALRRRVHRALMPLALALRLLPAFVAEARRLLEVDALRGGPRRGWGAVRRVLGLAPLWVTVVVRRADALALALIVRGYRPERDRGFARAYRFAAADWGLIGASLAAAIWIGGV